MSQAIKEHIKVREKTGCLEGSGECACVVITIFLVFTGGSFTAAGYVLARNIRWSMKSYYLPPLEKLLELPREVHHYILVCIVFWSAPSFVFLPFLYSVPEFQ